MRGHLAWAVLVLSAPLAHAAVNPGSQVKPPAQTADPKTSGLPLRSGAPVVTLDVSVVNSADTLTTESAWLLDPDEKNPHRLRWLLERSFELRELKPAALKGGKFGVASAVIHSQSRAYLRGPGPWFRTLDEFSCAAEPDAIFATREGTELAARVAGEAWTSGLEKAKARLARELEPLALPDPDQALASARKVVRRWARRVEEEWMGEARRRARQEEWRSYLTAAHRAGVCKPGKRREPPVAVPRWEERMEAPPHHSGGQYAQEGAQNRLLARAPARRWAGLFSVRVEVDAGGQTLNGQFLIDSGSARSLISPHWLSAQGINPAFLELSGTEKVRVTGMGGVRDAKRGFVFGARLAGLDLPLTEFLFIDSDLFFPPEYPASCCDGILGADFLKLYAVEFLPGEPSAVKIFAREGFSLGSELPWVELHTLPGGELASDCELSRPSRPKDVLHGVRWDTGADQALELHAPYASRVSRAGGEGWDLSCGTLGVARNIPAAVARPGSGSGPLTRKHPAANVGIELLSRGRFVMDAAHGRLWLDRAGLEARPAVDHSGLGLRFVKEDGDRVLKVLWIKPGSPAHELARAGLKPGMKIAALAGTRSEKLDPWSVRQRLVGALGEELLVEWESPRSKSEASAAAAKAAAAGAEGAAEASRKGSFQSARIRVR